MTKTRSFGSSNRENHDSSPFYNRRLFHSVSLSCNNGGQLVSTHTGDWVDRIYCQSAESIPIPDNSVALAFTSPPYNVGKDYDEDMSLEAYLGLIERVGREVFRVLIPGGRYVINIANLGRKPYIPLTRYFYEVHERIGFLAMGEIIWRKGRGASGNCAWGSWCSAKSPRLRDIHEYLLVFAKGGFGRVDTGKSDIDPEEFMSATLSVWEIQPESAKRVGHPAPFPISLALRVIRLFSYVGDVVLDPFCGSGTTCVASVMSGRHYVGIDINKEYCCLAEKRIQESEMRTRGIARIIYCGEQEDDAPDKSENS